MPDFDLFDYLQLCCLVVMIREWGLHHHISIALSFRLRPSCIAVFLYLPLGGKMKRFRDFIGYLLGGFLFVMLIPTIMWLASGMPALWPVDTWRSIVASVVMLVGLVLSIWPDAYRNPRLSRGCRRVAVDLAIVRRVCRLLCHHNGAGAKRRKTPPPRLRRRIRRVLQTLTKVLINEN